MREIEVLQLISDGLVNREIGQRLFLSEETVKSPRPAPPREAPVPLARPCGRRRLPPRHHRLDRDQAAAGRPTYLGNRGL